MAPCIRCFAPSDRLVCPACRRDEENYERQKDLIRQQRGETRPKDKDGCAKFILGCIVFTLIMMVYHAPSAWFVHRAHEIDWTEAIWASIECAEGWYSATLIWSTAAVLIWALFSIIAKEFKPVIMVPVVILSSFTTWYVWSHLDVIKASHDSSKVQSTAEAANTAAAEGYRNDSQNRATETSSGPTPQINRIWTLKDGREIDATFVKIENQIVYFKISTSEADFNVPFLQLTIGDQIVAKTLEATSVR